MMNIEEYQARLREIMAKYVSGFRETASDYSSEIDALMAVANAVGLDEAIMAAITIAEGKKLIGKIDDIEKEFS